MIIWVKCRASSECKGECRLKDAFIDYISKMSASLNRGTTTLPACSTQRHSMAVMKTMTPARSMQRYYGHNDNDNDACSTTTVATMPPACSTQRCDDDDAARAASLPCDHHLSIISEPLTDHARTSMSAMITTPLVITTTTRT